MILVFFSPVCKSLVDSTPKAFINAVQPLWWIHLQTVLLCAKWKILLMRYEIVNVSSVLTPVPTTIQRTFSSDLKQFMTTPPRKLIYGMRSTSIIQWNFTRCSRSVQNNKSAQNSYPLYQTLNWNILGHGWGTYYYQEKWVHETFLSNVFAPKCTYCNVFAPKCTYCIYPKCVK